MSYNTKRNANHDFKLTREAINYRGVKTREARQRRHRRHLAAETCAPLSQIASGETTGLQGLTIVTDVPQVKFAINNNNLATPALCSYPGPSAAL